MPSFELELRCGGTDTPKTANSAVEDIFKNAKPRSAGVNSSTRERNGKLQRYILMLAALEPGRTHYDYCKELAALVGLQPENIETITYAPSHYADMVEYIKNIL